MARDDFETKMQRKRGFFFGAMAERARLPTPSEHEIWKMQFTFLDFQLPFSMAASFARFFQQLCNDDRGE